MPPSFSRGKASTTFCPACFPLASSDSSKPARRPLHQYHVRRRTPSSQPPLADAQRGEKGRASDPRVTTPLLARTTQSQASTPTRTPAPAPASARAFASQSPLFAPLEEYHSGYAAEEEPARHYASPRSTTHRRRQSFFSLLPLALTSGSPSPERSSSRLWDLAQMPLTGDGPRPGARGDDSPRGIGAGLSNWLSMSTTNAGDASSPRQQGTCARDAAASSEAYATSQRARDPSAAASKTATPRNTTSTKTVTATASRFMSAISSRFNNPASPGLSSAPGLDAGEDDDEFCTLDIETALFPPTSAAANRDPFSPAAFRNLEQGAVGLLTRMQAAYRRRMAAARDLEAERGAQRDELAEADTRCRHLKMQLEGMAHKAQEQERAMRQLMDALHAERAARAEAEESLAAACRSASAALAAAAAGTTPRAESPVSEDLGVEEDRRRWRKSAASSASTVFDTDEDSSTEGESVFSRSRSPTLPGGGGGMMGAMSPPPPASASARTPRPKTRPSPLNMGFSPLLASAPLSLPPKPAAAAAATTVTGAGYQMSAFQKIMKGIAGAEAGAGSANDQGCRNCMGQDASVAWDTVGLLRDENRHLKRRMADLEETVDGVLDLVNGVGL